MKKSLLYVLILLLVFSAQCFSAQVLYVASRADDLIMKYDLDTGSSSVFASNDVDLVNPRGVTFGPDGSLYVACDGTNSILKYNTIDGSYSVFATGGDMSYPMGLRFGNDEYLYAVSSGTTNGVVRYGTLGQSSVVVSGGNISGPYDVDFGPDGKLYIASSNNNQIVVYDMDTYDQSIISADRPFSIAFTDSGDFYTTGYNANQIFKFTSNGGIYSGSTFASMSNPSSIAVSPDQEAIYVTGGNSIVRYDLDTATSTILATLNNPTGLAFQTETQSPVVPEPLTLILMILSTVGLWATKTSRDIT